METILTHFDTKLKAIEKNTGTEEDPVMVKVLKEVAEDQGQITSKTTLQLPAAYFDITEMNYSGAGDLVEIADTTVTLKLAVRKNDTTRYDTIKRITKALAGTNGTSFKGIMKRSQKRTEYDDIFVYTITFDMVFYDESAIPERETIVRPEPVINVIIS